LRLSALAQSLYEFLFPVIYEYYGKT